MLYDRLCDHGVSFVVGHDLDRIDADGAVLRSIYETGEQTVGAFDALVFAAGSRPVNSLASALAGKVNELHVVGAASESRFIFEATTDGARIGHTI